MRSGKEFFNHLKKVGFNPATVVDIGVANGTRDIYEAFPKAYYLLIEPVKEYEPKLQAILEEYRGEYLLKAASDEKGTAPMMVQEPFYVSSLQYGNTVREEAIREVPVDTLENILNERDIAKPIMVKTDCQGHDLKVIRGAGERLQDIEVIICEMPVFEPWGGGDEFSDYIVGLKELGFSFYDIWGWLYRPDDFRLQNIDLVFVKTDGLLRQNKLFHEGKANLEYFRKNHDIALWGLEDYAVWVPLADRFYRDLPFNRTTEEGFRAGKYVAQKPYKDSRTYLRPLVKHLTNIDPRLQILDVGGYIGRFSIEAKLTAREMDLEFPIVCFEPGETRNLIFKNLAVNDMKGEVQVHDCAVAEESKTVTFGVPQQARITSRIINSKGSTSGAAPQQWAFTEVQCQPLSKFMSWFNRPFICKIDTEGHEAKVIEGIGKKRLKRPHALIVEFWPRVLNEEIFGQRFETFLLENYTIYNIQSSLYPRGWDVITDFKDLSASIESGELNNVDLLLISHTIKDVNAEIEKLASTP